jgi:hypothetical protein
MYNRWMPAAKDSLAMEEADRSECDRILRSRKTAVNVPSWAEIPILAARCFPNRRIAFELGINVHVFGGCAKNTGSED